MQRKRNYVFDDSGKLIAKVCTECSIEKSVESFYRKSAGNPATAAICKDCVKAKKRKGEGNGSEINPETGNTYFLDYIIDQIRNAKKRL